ncbi:unnamed protein product [Amoebophrya sp. A25]|nr:unnamed protein product [Amoebophrya sp. A25]|eukprot:GSA25T00014040001.1
MVLPVPGIEFLDDSVVPEPSRKYFIWLRYALITEMVLAVFRMCLGDIAGALSDIICILFGIFFMRNDEVIEQIYRYLKNTMIAMCCGGGGFRVLMPFCFLSGLNGVFNLLIFIQFPVLVVYTILTSVLGLVELFCAFCGWQIYKSVSSYQLGGMGGGFGGFGAGARPAGGNAAGGGRVGGGSPGGSGGPGAAPGFGGLNAPPAQQPGFQVFQGQGRRLGD